jgi:hypothetical protein
LAGDGIDLGIDLLLSPIHRCGEWGITDLVWYRIGQFHLAGHLHFDEALAFEPGPGHP